MRIVFSSSFDEGALAMARAAEALSEAQRQVSTGLRISRPSEDPLSAAASITEHAELGLADTVLTDIVNQLTAAQTTALAGMGSAKTQAERDAAANELLAIRDALMGDINTRFQGAYLFSGSNVTVAPYVASGGGISAYQGDSDTASIDVGAGRSVASLSCCAR